MKLLPILLTLAAFSLLPHAALSAEPGLTLARDKNWLVIQGAHLPKGEIRINYLEAYCRPNSTDADWHDTTIGHTTELLSLSEDRRTMKLRCTVKDGVVVDHTITAGADEVIFSIVAHNPGTEASNAHWAQPCIRLGDFTGYDSKGGDIDDYLPKCFLFLDGKLTRMSEVKPWNREARYIPGQVWCPAHVPRTDVNPRPLSPRVPDNGLIGCFSGDEKLVFAVAFEPYQELFQGVARCLHSDFRIGGLKPGEKKEIQGRIYIVANDIPALLARYGKDFPSQQPRTNAGGSSQPVRAVMDDEQPGWRALTAEDFAKVNSADDTWTWQDGALHCTGRPVSVLRTAKEYRNFEMVVEWSHQKPAGNSGVFIWATPASIEKLTAAGKPGLPQGIEVQVLDHAFTEKRRARGETTDWFGTNGDVFPVGVKMKPFPPLSPDGSRSFPRKHLAKGHGEWNHYYIRGINGEVRLWVNGEEVSGGTACEPSQGYLCLESEGSPIIFRKLRIRELP